MKDNVISGPPQLIVMLTHNDLTVSNAMDFLDICRDIKVPAWGMKEKPLPLSGMKRLYRDMKDTGAATVLEIVAYDERAGLDGAAVAAECGCDIVMGSKFHASIADFCHRHSMRYYPFVGEVVGRPSVLQGTPEGIIAEARDVIARGADGIDLLGYRYAGDAAALNRMVVQGVDAPVCIAGSIDSLARLDEVADASPYAFTIGSAFFQNKFGDTFPDQIAAVLRHVSNIRKKS